MHQLPQLIHDSDALEHFCAGLAGHDAIAVDTEFLRERTYYPRLCLIQIATADAVACIDPLAVDNLDAVERILQDPGVVKLFHSAKQDFEVLSLTFGRVPAPLFDTQVAAAFAGFGEQIGYAALVRAMLNVDLPKTQTRTQWCARPLRAEQLQYAGDDVRYLGRLYRELRATLRDQGKLAWATEDMGALQDPDLYRTDPEDAHRRLSAGKPLTAAQRQSLCSLAAWRERVAQEKDLPREWVVRGNDLVRIARAMPGSVDALRSISGLDERRVARWSRQLFTAATSVAGSAADSEPWLDSVRLSPAQRTLEKQMHQRVAQRAASLDLPASVLATRADLKRIALGAGDVPVLGGWRLGAIGAELQAIAADSAAQTDTGTAG